MPAIRRPGGIIAARPPSAPCPGGLFQSNQRDSLAVGARLWVRENRHRGSL